MTRPSSNKWRKEGRKRKGSSNRLPLGCLPPLGDKFCQKMEWLMWPPPLNLMAPCSWMALFKSPRRESRTQQHQSAMTPSQHNWPNGIPVQSINQSINRPYNCTNSQLHSSFRPAHAAYWSTFFQCCEHLLFGGIQVLHVGCVVLLMVELHDFGRDDRLQGVVFVGQVGQSVARAESSVALCRVRQSRHVSLPRYRDKAAQKRIRIRRKKCENSGMRPSGWNMAWGRIIHHSNPSINRTMEKSINQSINQSINRRMVWCTFILQVNQLIHRTNRWCVSSLKNAAL